MSQGPLQSPDSPGDAPLKPVPGTVKLDTAPDVGTSPRVAGYKLLQKIGEGGCGIVYMAQQEVPVRRRVALKVIKPGMDTKEVLARFEAERQALAMMDHPNIARVFDGGSTESGHPFFVMELVKGIRITEYCDQNNLTTRERLQLFTQVCHAIQHAHHKGVIHRDIKPSNLLVADHDGVPVPKVIDFGIAKAIDQQLTEKTLFTALGQFIGTPAYMSPEQARLSGLDIDTRSDIYSLGVLLYELLTGRTPFETRRLVEAGFDEIRRIIREEDPPRPSTRLSSLALDEQTTIAKRRQCDIPKLLRVIRGDLDWIVMKALEKDRQRRYQSAGALAEDIQRHSQDEPVLARPPSFAYRFTKFARKHRAKGMAAAGALFVLIAALVSGFLLVKEARTGRFGAVEIRSYPEGAEVWRAGHLLGTTPFTAASLNPGQMAFSLKLANHETVETDIPVARRERARILVFLKSKPVDLAVASVAPIPASPATTPPTVVTASAPTNPAVAVLPEPTLKVEVVRMQIPAATIESVSGMVRVVRSGTSQELAAEVGMPLAVGDSLRTGPNARAGLRLPDRTVVRLAALTTFVLTTNSIQLKKGSFQVSPGTNGTDFQIEMPGGRARIRG